MTLSLQLEKLERFSAKVWRQTAKEDPIGHLSFNEYDYLKAVQSLPDPIRLTDLANALEVSKPSATNMVTKLESKGLLVRMPCSIDARAKRISLTERAKQYLALELAVYALIAEEVGKNLSQDERIQLDNLLTKALG